MTHSFSHLGRVRFILTMCTCKIMVQASGKSSSHQQEARGRVSFVFLQLHWSRQEVFKDHRSRGQRAGTAPQGWNPLSGSSDSEGNGRRKDWGKEVEQQGGQSKAADGSEVREKPGNKSVKRSSNGRAAVTSERRRRRRSTGLVVAAAAAALLLLGSARAEPCGPW